MRSVIDVALERFKLDQQEFAQLAAAQKADQAQRGSERTIAEPRRCSEVVV